MEKSPTVLILTPVKDAESHLVEYLGALLKLSFPHDRISLGFIESDSTDQTFARLQEVLPSLEGEFRRVYVGSHPYGFHIPDGVPRWAHHIQVQRRAILAKSRNRLLFSALRDEDWVLWLDVDVVEYPNDILQQLLRAERDIVQPNCVKTYGGPSFDLNAWRDKGRYHLHDLKAEGNLVPLDAVGGTMLLVKADLHREGLNFPPYLYGGRNPLARGFRRFAPRGLRALLERPVTGEIETEGLGLMARDMGYQCWGMPNLEIRHKDA